MNISFADTGKTRVDQKKARKCKTTECPVDNFRNPYSYLAVQGLPETCKIDNVSTNCINLFGHQIDAHIFKQNCTCEHSETMMEIGPKVKAIPVPSDANSFTTFSINPKTFGILCILIKFYLTWSNNVRNENMNFFIGLQI